MPEKMHIIAKVKKRWLNRIAIMLWFLKGWLIEMHLAIGYL
jgi:hypothetical protein